MTQNPIPEDDFNLDEWLSTGTLARRAVPIYNDPSLAAEFDVLAQRLSELEAMTKGEESSVGESAEITEVYEQMVAVHERWEASKATWTVRALTEDEVKAITDEHPDPEVPEVLRAKRQPGTVWDDVQRAEGQAFIAAREEAITERNLAMIALAVVEVATSRGSTSTVTVEQVRRLQGRPHGKQQVTRLIEAVTSATTGDIEIPRPTLPGRSDSDRG